MKVSNSLKTTRAVGVHPIALRMAKTLWSFGRSKSIRLKGPYYFGHRIRQIEPIPLSLLTLPLSVYDLKKRYPFKSVCPYTGMLA